jgi:hypothetical protein
LLSFFGVSLNGVFRHVILEALAEEVRGIFFSCHFDWSVSGMEKSLPQATVGML